MKRMLSIPVALIVACLCSQVTAEPVARILVEFEHLGPAFQGIESRVSMHDDLIASLQKKIGDRLQSEIVELTATPLSEATLRLRLHDLEEAVYRCYEPLESSSDKDDFDTKILEMGSCLVALEEYETSMDFRAAEAREADVDFVVSIRAYGHCTSDAPEEGSCFYGAAFLIVEPDGRSAVSAWHSEETCCGGGMYGRDIFASKGEAYERLVLPIEDTLGPHLIEAIRRQKQP